MRNTPASGRPDLEARVLAGRACNEDAVVLRVPPGHALVQSVDVLTPVVNDAFAFGRIAAANALSDIWSAMNVAFFPPALAEDDPEGLLTSILRGGLDAMNEAGAVLAGGHTVQDEELKYGLAVTGVIDPEHLARNDGLRPGQVLLLTKPLGTGVLSTAVKAGWDGAAASEANLVRWCGRLNSVGGTVIRELRLSAATDITGFGLGGHALEMALASHVCVRLVATALPLLPRALEYARDGLIPAGSHRNRTHCACRTRTAQAVDEALESLAFDAQTSGGLLLAVPPDQVEAARALLLGGGDLAAVVGEVLPPRPDGIALLLE